MKRREDDCVEEKKYDWRVFMPPVFCGLIIAVGLVAAALIFSSTLADRPMYGSFTGNLSAGAVSDPDVMDLDGLKYYLGIYPSWDDAMAQSEAIYYAAGDEEDNLAPHDSPLTRDPYDEREEELREELRANITGGAWPGFPYVQLGGELYFSKQAVDEWFAEQGKQQLIVP